MSHIKGRQWQKIARLVSVNTPWLKVICEQYVDNSKKLLNYWRVEKDDSAIAITLQGNKILLPNPIFRPGIQKVTLDFPGGRVPSNSTPKKEIENILQRELKIKLEDILEITHINEKGWPINSSFSNQLLWGFIVRIAPNANLHKNKTICFSNSIEGISRLLTKINCLQCRAIFLEFLRTNKSSE